MNNIKNRLKGSLYGFAIGDAMGATTEFMSEDEIKSEYGKLTDIVGGGWLDLIAGEVTDDTQMSICVMEVLMKNKNKKLSTEYIYNHVWSKDDDSDTGYVWIYISYLKQKLKAINANVDILGEENREFELVEV